MASGKNRALVVGSLILLAALFQAQDGYAAFKNEAAKSIPIQHNGRVKSFYAYSLQVVETVTGKAQWEKKSPEDFVLGLLQSPESILSKRWIQINFNDLLNYLKLDPQRHYFSFEEVIPSLDSIEGLMRQAQAKRDKDLRPSKLEQEAETLYSRLVTVKHLHDGDVLTVIPAPGDGAWSAPVGSKDPKAQAFKKLISLYGDANHFEFEKAAADWNRSVYEVAQGQLKNTIWLELLYMDSHPFQWSWVFYLLATVGLMTVKKKGFWRNGSALFLILAFGFHTMGLALRCLILGRPPVSNMFESMVYMNWALMVFAAGFYLIRRQRIFLSVGAAISALVMIYGNLLPLDEHMEVLAPVLRSNYWLTIHVMTIVASYGAFGLAMGLGHRQLILGLRGKLSKQAEETSAHLIHRVIQLGVLLIGIGTVLGGVWANESWGRFWGWDPKETWALITFLAYLVVVHMRYSKIISHFWMAMSAILGFFFVLMTWYGVNFVLGRGLHSYGFGAGGMHWVAYYVVLEILFMAVVFFKRR